MTLLQNNILAICRLFCQLNFVSEPNLTPERFEVDDKPKKFLLLDDWCQTSGWQRQIQSTTLTGGRTKFSIKRCEDATNACISVVYQCLKRQAFNPPYVPMRRSESYERVNDWGAADLRKEPLSAMYVNCHTGSCKDLQLANRGWYIFSASEWVKGSACLWRPGVNLCTCTCQVCLAYLISRCHIFLDKSIFDNAYNS